MTTNLTRRSLIVGVAAMVFAPRLHAESRKMSAADAHAAAGRGDVLLLDIRSRQEWQQTGVGETALTVSMHEKGFLRRLQSLTAGDKSRPIALICAVGGRSRSLQHILARKGYTHVIDVAEGMIGGPNGRGWIKSGLPMTLYKP